MLLVKYHDELFRGDTKDITVLIPLCGKSVDIKWLYDQGYRVIGIEGTKSVVSAFFFEHNLKPEVEPKPEIGGAVYKTADGRLKIYVCDIFRLNESIVGKVDVIFDRGAFGAVPKENRKRYVTLMRSWLSSSFKYLLIVFQYSDWYYSWSPRPVPDGVVRELFGEFCAIDERDHNDKSQLIDRTETLPITEVVYFMTSK